MKKIAYSGTHGTGKTTSVYKAAHQLQVGGKEVCILAEAALQCPLPISKKATPESQLWIFTRQISDELAVGDRFDYIVCDRTIADAVAYTRINGHTEMADAMERLALPYLQTYHEIRFKRLANNRHETGGDNKYRAAIDQEIFNIYRRARVAYGKKLTLIME